MGLKGPHRHNALRVGTFFPFFPTRLAVLLLAWGDRLVTMLQARVPYAPFCFDAFRRDIAVGLVFTLRKSFNGTSGNIFS
jgi:hypothetical protein